MSRPGTITGGAVLAYIGGAFMLVVGGILAMLGSLPEAQEAVETLYGPGTGSLVSVIGGVIAVIGILIVVFGAFAHRGKQWGAIALAVIAGFAVAGAVLDVVSGRSSSVLAAVWSVTSAALLLSNRAREWYRSQR